jgi:hypothetical protein
MIKDGEIELAAQAVEQIIKLAAVPAKREKRKLKQWFAAQCKTH